MNLNCSYCEAVGSTLGCYIKGCTLRYHYLCAMEAVPAEWSASQASLPGAVRERLTPTKKNRRQGLETVSGQDGEEEEEDEDGEEQEEEENF
ncbi:hypothetical protein CRUP_005551 [Coryphaenoides rupestris]|nr:hypothetical protein CRUP_005551 [Coryphaenoides rupestris]